jgi:hypothetical protein
MSRILKRPMFRIGGKANEEGIISMATPRKNYQAGGYDMEAIEKVKRAYRDAAGPGPNTRDSLNDLLISGGLNLLSGRGAGKGTLGAVAESFKDPYAAFAKSTAGEDAFKRQLDIAAVTQGITSQDAERLARIKVKQEGENEEVVTLTKLLQLSGVQNPYAVAKTQIDFKKRHGEDMVTTPVNRDEKGKLSARQLAGISPGQVFLINDPKSGLITARKTDEAGNYKLIDPLTNKEKVPPAVTPPKTYSEIISQNPLSIRRNTLMQEYLKKQQEKKKNISSMGD